MLEKLTKLLAEGYDFPEITPDIPHGDMPGDKIEIGESHIAKAKVIFPELLKELQENGKEKAVLCVCGGSGVGKSEIDNLNVFAVACHHDVARLDIAMCYAMAMDVSQSVE